MNLLFGFSGRIGRGQWWLAQLAILAIIGIAIACVYAIVLSDDPNRETVLGRERLDPYAARVLLLIAAALIPMIWINFAAMVKRFHDRDKSGFWSLIVFVPYIGGIWATVECGFLAGSEGTNSYGPPPGYGHMGYEEFGDDTTYGYSKPEPSMRYAACRAAGDGHAEAGFAHPSTRGPRIRAPRPDLTPSLSMRPPARGDRGGGAGLAGLDLGAAAWRCAAPSCRKTPSAPKMPFFDLSPSELVTYRSRGVAPDDFDAFWAETLRGGAIGAARRDVHADRYRADAVRVFDVTFAGFGGHPVRGWYIRPRGREVDRGAW